ncbi:hypothetical protein KUTeg_013932 [Tegillarca granosa]|uniref:Uncharacterized protein n=1 Tax=Tegillarca granosa TaxID=220873 RepID=A0ABQ9F0J8_TEGGR|nr:hypothetical protein KUTeg_013932 [Tegillarca granosa]
MDEAITTENKSISTIIPRDHFFDTKERSRKEKKNKGETVSTNRNAVQKGTLGIRWEKARLDESKILLTKKMGISDE